MKISSNETRVSRRKLRLSKKKVFADFCFFGKNTSIDFCKFVGKNLMV